MLRESYPPLVPVYRCTAINKTFITVTISPLRNTLVVITAPPNREEASKGNHQFRLLPSTANENRSLTINVRRE